MTNAELYNILLDNGWTIRKGIDDCAYKQLPDRQIQVIPGIKNLIDEYQIIMMTSVSTKDFSILVEYIEDNKKPRKIVHSGIVKNKQDCIQTNNPTRGVVETYLQDIEVWAHEQDTEAGLKQYCKLPTDSKGNLPLHHLSALAISGQSKQLANYLEHFKKSDNMGFVPYIKQDFIERALEAAKKNTQILLNILKKAIIHIKHVGWEEFATPNEQYASLKH